MQNLLDTVLVLLILSNFMLLGTSRLGACIRMLAAQGVLLGALQVLVHRHALSAPIVLLAVGGAAIKGLLIPGFLRRAVHDAGVRREVEPLIGYTWSLILGTFGLAAALWAGQRVGLSLGMVPSEPATVGAALPAGLDSPLVVAVALYTMLVGTILIVGRRKAITQVMGYLALENGIYAFGVGLAQEEPLLVSMGVLLDLFVAIFVMGIIIFHINREFDSIDTDRLVSLRDDAPGATVESRR